MGTVQTEFLKGSATDVFGKIHDFDGNYWVIKAENIVNVRVPVMEFTLALGEYLRLHPSRRLR